jgi:ParB/RepB/Spo0J family partition protein
MAFQMIALTTIKKPEWNSRLDPAADKPGETLEQLGKSLQVKQLQPIIVELLPDGLHELVAGSRRCAAAELVGLTELMADVREATDEATRALDNFTENAQRKQLTTFETARAAAHLRALKVPLAKVADHMGVSKGYVSNLVGMYERLAPPIIEAWKNGDEAATVDCLQALTQIKGKTAEIVEEKQLKKYNERVELLRVANDVIEGNDGDDNDDNDAATGKGKNKGKGKGGEKVAVFKVPAQRYFDAVQAVRKARLPGGAVILNMMKLLIGEVEVVKGIIDLKADDSK